MQQVVYVANPVSGLIHVFQLQDNELVPLQEVQTGGEVQPLVISPDKRWLYAGVRPDFRVLSYPCLLYTSPSPRDGLLSRMPSSA